MTHQDELDQDLKLIRLGPSIYTHHTSAQANSGNQNRHDTMIPPPLPEGYRAIGDVRARPLMSVDYGLWIVLANGEDETMGALVYQDLRPEPSEPLFYWIAEECVTVLYSLLEWSASLLQCCTPEYVARHAAGVALIRDYIWSYETDQAKRHVDQEETHSKKSRDTQPGWTLHIGNVVTIPAAQHGEYEGTTGTIAGQVYPDPSDNTPVCLVDVPGIGIIVFAVSDLQAMNGADQDSQGQEGTDKERTAYE